MNNSSMTALAVAAVIGLSTVPSVAQNSGNPHDQGGTNGTDGIDGTNGTDGIAGTNGTEGIAGTNGTDGIAGTNGTNSSSTNTHTYTADRQYRYVAPAYAPTVMPSFGNDSCQGSVSAGVGTGIVNLSFGKTTIDANCQRIKLSRRLEELSLPDVACTLLALDLQVAEAMKLAQRTCGLENFSKAK